MSAGSSSDRDDFLIPWSLAEGKIYIDRARTLAVLSDDPYVTDAALLGESVRKLDTELIEKHSLLTAASTRRLSTSTREHHVADGWFVPIAPRGKPELSTLSKKVAPRKPRDRLYGQLATRELLRLSHERYRDDPDKLTGYRGLMLYRLNDALYWISLLVLIERASVRHYR